MYIKIQLCFSSSHPYPLDCLGQANVIRFKLVQPHTDSQSCCTQTPPKQGAGFWQSFRRYIVNYYGPSCVNKAFLETTMFHILETNMRVDQDSSAEDRIRDRVEGPGSEWSYCQWY